MKGEPNIGVLCELLGVSRSGYYRWQQPRPTRRQREDADLAAHIARFHRQSRGNYGARPESSRICVRRAARRVAAGAPG